MCPTWFHADPPLFNALFKRIVLIAGGLHYPVNGGRIMIGPINIQSIVGSDRPPWISTRE